MRCVFCDAHDSKVIDSRSADGGYSIRRRRECIACGKRFTTYERVEQYSVFVVKRDGRREPFSIDKIKNGLRHACQKLPVSTQQIDDLASKIEKLAYAKGGEISTETIGDIIMEELKNINEVAYVRFASVYRSFKDINTFMEELSKLLTETK
jgi:transcriptional repressor NrdR